MSRRKRRVYVHSGLQNAQTDEPLAAGARVMVIIVRGMTVKVRKERDAVW